MIDIEAIRDKWLVQCGPCDFGLVEMACNCPTGEPRAVIMDLCDEVERLHAALDRGWPS